MLAKLLKYEMKSSARTLIPLYIGTIAAAAICALQVVLMTGKTDAVNMTVAFNNAGFVASIMFLLLFAFSVATAVMTAVIIIQRFNRNLIGNEGYLMFTLPVSHKQLICSKLLAALLWTIVGTVVMGIAGIILFCPALMEPGIDWMNELQYMWNYWVADRVTELTTYFVLYTADALLSLVAMILTIYLAIMIGQTELFNRHRVAVSVVAFFVLNWIFSAVLTTLLSVLGYANVGMALFQQDGVVIILLDMLFTVLQAGVCFYGTEKMMQKKLNL